MYGEQWRSHEVTSCRVFSGDHASGIRATNWDGPVIILRGQDRADIGNLGEEVSRRGRKCGRVGRVRLEEIFIANSNTEDVVETVLI